MTACILRSPYLRIEVETKNLLFSVFRGLPSVQSPKIWAPNSTPGPSYDSSKFQKKNFSRIFGFFFKIDETIFSTWRGVWTSYLGVLYPERSSKRWPDGFHQLPTSLEIFASQNPTGPKMTIYGLILLSKSEKNFFLKFGQIITWSSQALSWGPKFCVIQH